MQLPIKTVNTSQAIQSFDVLSPIDVLSPFARKLEVLVWETNFFLNHGLSLYHNCRFELSMTIYKCKVIGFLVKVNTMPYFSQNVQKLCLIVKLVTVCKYKKKLSL